MERDISNWHALAADAGISSIFSFAKCYPPPTLPTLYKAITRLRVSRYLASTSRPSPHDDRCFPRVESDVGKA